MLSRCFHFGVFEIFVSSLFLLVLFAFWECWYSALYNSEADSEKEDHDGCRCLYLPHCSCTGSAFVLWTLLNRRCHEESRGTISWLSIIQGAATPTWIYGHPRVIHLLGGSHDRHCHSRLHHSLLSGRIRSRTDCTGRCHNNWCRTDSVQTEKRAA